MSRVIFSFSAHQGEYKIKKEAFLDELRSDASLVNAMRFMQDQETPNMVACSHSVLTRTEAEKDDLVKPKLFNQDGRVREQMEYNLVAETSPLVLFDCRPDKQLYVAKSNLKEMIRATGLFRVELSVLANKLYVFLDEGARTIATGDVDFARTHKYHDVVTMWSCIEDIFGEGARRGGSVEDRVDVISPNWICSEMSFLSQGYGSFPRHLW